MNRAVKALLFVLWSLGVALGATVYTANRLAAQVEQIPNKVKNKMTELFQEYRIEIRFEKDNTYLQVERR